MMPVSSPVRMPSVQLFRKRKERMNVTTSSTVRELDDSRSDRKTMVKAMTYARCP